MNQSRLNTDADAKGIYYEFTWIQDLAIRLKAALFVELLLAALL